MTSRTLIHGGCVLTLGDKTPNFREADVLIEDDRVAEVGQGLRARDAEQVDAAGTIVMPGFVDTHRHAWKTLFRGLGDGAGADHQSSVNLLGRHHQPDDVYAGTLIGLLGAIEAGITTVVDWSDIQLDDRYSEAALQAHADAGLRTVFVPSVPRWAEGAAPADSVLRRVAAGRGSNSFTDIAAGPPDPLLSDIERVAGDWSSARDLGLRIHAHAGVDTPDSGIAELGKRGLLDGDVTLVHCSALRDADLDAIASHGVAVALTPSTEMAVGLGAPPLQRLIDRGIRPGLGVDDERVAPGDLFAQMRAAHSLQHATHFDLKLAGKAGLPNLLGTRDVIRYATADGARVAGLGDVTGSLEVGKHADIVILRADRPNIFPVNDPIGAVVWGMDASNVDWVFVGGRPLLRNGVLEADVSRARELALVAQQRVAGAAGLLQPSFGGST